MEEARMTQHICFKSAERSTPTEAHRMLDGEVKMAKHPEIKVDQACHEPTRLGNDACCGAFSPQNVPTKSFLFLPMPGHRDRRTSTPNPEVLRVTPSVNTASEVATCSPVQYEAASPPKRWPKKSCDLDGIRSILFPQLDDCNARRVTKEELEKERDERLLDSANKRKRESSSEESSPVSSGRALWNSVDFSVLGGDVSPERTKSSESRSAACSPYKMKPHAFETSICHDSGLESMNATCTDANSTSYTLSSPLKRQASPDGAMVSVESPLKRLAFMSLEQGADYGRSNARMEGRIAFPDPGSSFFSDRLEPDNNASTDSGIQSFNSGNDSICSTYNPPAPIFANSIPFRPPHLPKRTDPMSGVETALEERKSVGPTVGDFRFTKPSLACHPRKKYLKGKMSPPTPTSPQKTDGKFLFASDTASPTSSCKIGDQYVDFLTELSDRNLHHVINTIFSNIRQKDILRCSKVSRSWNNACHKNKFLRTQIKSLKKHYQEEESTLGPENFSAKQALEDALLRSPAKLDVSMDRSVLRNMQNTSSVKRTSPTKKPPPPKTPSGKNYFVEAETKFEHNQRVKRTLNFGESLMHCPKCQWTAKVYGSNLVNQGQCYRARCRYRFCVLCKNESHWPKPCAVWKPVSPEKVQAAKIGSKKRMARLKKRLLL